MGVMLNEHTTAIVPIQWWAYESPLLRRDGRRGEEGPTGVRLLFRKVLMQFLLELPNRLRLVMSTLGGGLRHSRHIAFDDAESTEGTSVEPKSPLIARRQKHHDLVSPRERRLLFRKLIHDGLKMEMVNLQRSPRSLHKNWRRFAWFRGGSGEGALVEFGWRDLIFSHNNPLVIGQSRCD